MQPRETQAALSMDVALSIFPQIPGIMVPGDGSSSQIPVPQPMCSVPAPGSLWEQLPAELSAAPSPSLGTVGAAGDNSHPAVTLSPWITAVRAKRWTPDGLFQMLFIVSRYSAIHGSWVTKAQPKACQPQLWVLKPLWLHFQCIMCFSLQNIVIHDNQSIPLLLPRAYPNY